MEVCQRWDQLLRYAALKLGVEIGSEVQEVISRAHRDDVQQRNRAFVESVCDDGTLAGTLRVPDTIADIAVTADLRARLVTTSAVFDAPRDRGARARVTWLTRQLRDTEGSLIIETYARGARAPVVATLEQLLQDPRAGLGESRKEPVRFRVLRRSEMGQGRRTTRKPGFIDGILNAVTVFYGDVPPEPPSRHTTGATPRTPPRYRARERRGITGLANRNVAVSPAGRLGIDIAFTAGAWSRSVIQRRSARRRLPMSVDVGSYGRVEPGRARRRLQAHPAWSSSRIRIARSPSSAR